MIAFEIRVNGKKVCTAGIRQFGNLCAHLNWSRGPQVAPATGFQHCDELLEFVVAGAQVRHKRRKAPNLKRGFRYTEGLEWTAHRLKVGDEITISIVEASRIDAPRKRKRLRDGIRLRINDYSIISRTSQQIHPFFCEQSFIRREGGQ